MSRVGINSRPGRRFQHRKTVEVRNGRRTRTRSPHLRNGQETSSEHGCRSPIIRRMTSPGVCSLVTVSELIVVTAIAIKLERKVPYYLKVILLRTITLNYTISRRSSMPTAAVGDRTEGKLHAQASPCRGVGDVLARPRRLRHGHPGR